MRLDYDEDQPRAANGEWGAGGGSKLAARKHAALMVADWKATSSSKGALQLRSAAARVLAEKYGVRPEVMHAIDKKAHLATIEGKGKGAEHDKIAAQAGEHVDTFKALAGQAQSAHGEHTQLFRGVYGKQAEQIQKMAAAAKKAGQNHVDIDLGLLSSWSESHEVAKTFSSGVVLRQSVEREKIALSHRTSKHLDPTEKEVVVMTSGRIRVPLSDILLHKGK